MKRALTVKSRYNLWHRVDGVVVGGACSGLRGDCSGLWGNCSGLRGDCSGLWGNCSGLSGDCSECDLTEDERRSGVDIQLLVKNGDEDACE